VGRTLDAGDRFGTRSGRFAWLAACAIGLVFAFGAARLRRLELAFALHLGMRRRDVVGLLCLELILVLVPTVSLSLIGTVTWLQGQGWPHLWPFGLAVIAAGALGAVLGVIVAGVCVSQRRVMTYLKAR